jgi:hypothetical protein
MTRSPETAGNVLIGFDDMEKHEQLSFVLKREIVQRLARFDTPSQVVKAIKADHGIDLSPQRVQFYDPRRRTGPL